MLSKCDIYLYIFMYSSSCGTQGENWRMETKQEQRKWGQMKESSLDGAAVDDDLSYYINFSTLFV